MASVQINRKDKLILEKSNKIGPLFSITEVWKEILSVTIWP